MRLKTVDVDRDGTRVTINERDFDPQRDKLWGSTEFSQPATDGPDEKDQLIAALAEQGVTMNRRSSIKKLRQALEEASQ